MQRAYTENGLEGTVEVNFVSLYTCVEASLYVCGVGAEGWRRGRGAVINEGMSLCYCMYCQREGPSERKQSEKKKKKEGKERCTRQLLCPRALPRNVTQCREQLLGLRRPEGQGWHQRVHILYTHLWIHTHISLFQCMFQCIAFCHVRFGFFWSLAEKKPEAENVQEKEDFIWCWKRN